MKRYRNVKDENRRDMIELACILLVLLGLAASGAIHAVMFAFANWIIQNF